MRHILLESLLLGLDDLLTKRLPALQSFANGAANVKLLSTQRDRIAALPAALTGRPLTSELEVSDLRHDGLGAGMWFILEAYLRHPDTSAAMLDAIKKIRAAFIPALDSLTATYEAEARAAKDHKAALASLKNELSLFPVAGGTLYDWATSFVAAGEKLDVFLSERADAKDRAAAARLRTDAIGVLNRLRKSLAAEAKHDTSLPADLDAQVFAYLDLLETKAADSYAEAKKKAKEVKATKEAAPPSPGDEKSIA
jgi:hypothetical protein